MGLTTAFSASGVIRLSSDREAGRDDESGRERCTEKRRLRGRNVISEHRYHLSLQFMSYFQNILTGIKLNWKN